MGLTEKIRSLGQGEEESRWKWKPWVEKPDSKEPIQSEYPPPSPCPIYLSLPQKTHSPTSTKVLSATLSSHRTTGRIMAGDPAERSGGTEVSSGSPNCVWASQAARKGK